MHPSVTFLSKILHFVCLWDSFIKFLVECENNRCSLQFSIILAIVGPVSGLFAVFQLGIKWKASADVSSANAVSYTHLDVYKRQVYGSGRPRGLLGRDPILSVGGHL